MYTSTKNVKLKIECPVNLSMIDDDGDIWAEATNESISNNNVDKGNLYTLGENNDIKIAYLNQLDNKVLLTGTGNGVMNYTASIFDAGYEIERVIFRNVPITKNTKIYTNTDFANGLKLELDEDSDAKIDKVIEPTNEYKGSDLDEELDDDEDYYSNYGLISKNTVLSTNLASKKLRLDTNILSSGLLSIISDDFKETGIFNTQSYMLNAKSQDVKNINLVDNMEQNLIAYIKDAIPSTDFNTIENSKIIGNTCYLKNDKFVLNKSLNVINDLRYNAKEFISEKPVVLTSEKGYISIIASDKFDFKGVIYAPNGTVTITGGDVNFDGVIIANKIFITGTDTQIKNTLKLTELGE